MTEPTAAPQPNCDETVRARAMLVWLRPRLIVLGLLMVFSFLALAIVSQFDDLPIPKFFSQVFGLLWVLGLVQATNLTIVHFFTRGVLRWIVLTTWISVQALGVFAILTLHLTDLGLGGSTEPSEQTPPLVLFGAMIGELVYWLATYFYVRKPPAACESFTDHVTDKST